MAIEIADQKVILWFIREHGPKLRELADAAHVFNYLPNIAWRYREQIRSVEGFLEKADDVLLEMCGRLEMEDGVMEEAAEVMALVWGPLED